MRALLSALMTLMLITGLSASAAHAQSPEKEMKIGFVYVSPVGNEGWSYSHDIARKYLETLPGVKTYFMESIAEGPDAERAIQNMARKGMDIIFTISFGYMDSTLKVAKKFPDTTFMNCSGYKTAPICCFVSPSAPVRAISSAIITERGHTIVFFASSPFCTCFLLSRSRFKENCV